MTGLELAVKDLHIFRLDEVHREGVSQMTSTFVGAPVLVVEFVRVLPVMDCFSLVDRLAVVLPHMVEVVDVVSVVRLLMGQVTSRVDVALGLRLEKQIVQSQLD